MMRTLPLALMSVLTATGLVLGQSTVTPKERALIDLIKSSAESTEPGVRLLAGLANLPDGRYGRQTIKRAIDNMDGFSETPQGTEAEFLALLDRWAAVDETLGKTREIVKRGDRLTLKRDAVQTLPFRGGELKLAKEISLRIRSLPVAQANPAHRASLQGADLGSSYVRVSDVEGVGVDGGAVTELLLHRTGTFTPTVSYYVQGETLGMWRSHTFDKPQWLPALHPALAAQAAKGNFDVDLQYDLAHLPLRAGPEPKAPVLDLLTSGTRVQVLSEEDSPRWQVRVGNKIGYVHKDHLAPRADKTRQGLTSKLPLAFE